MSHKIHVIWSRIWKLLIKEKANYDIIHCYSILLVSQTWQKGISFVYHIKQSHNLMIWVTSDLAHLGYFLCMCINNNDKVWGSTIIFTIELTHGVYHCDFHTISPWNLKCSLLTIQVLKLHTTFQVYLTGSHRLKPFKTLSKSFVNKLISNVTHLQWLVQV